jgi:cytochrome P450
LNPGFSEKAVREQEPILMGYVDLLIQRLHENSHSPVDLVKWFNATTFDVVGDLTFGEPYGSLETSQVHVHTPFHKTSFSTNNLQFYIQTIFHALKSILFLALLRGYGLHKILLAMAPKSVKQKQKDHMAVNEGKLKKRMESGSSRPDL